MTDLITLLSEWDERREKATPGSWDRDPANSSYPSHVVIRTSRLPIAEIRSVNDCEFISQARTEHERLSKAVRVAYHGLCQMKNSRADQFIKEIAAILKG